ncbi:MAG: general secretion pathway protein GspK [Thermodesulfovibrionales bacterium]|nr:general secretion pathway protein GspK [Thermodesulfovibrionales bacterium]
MRQNENGIVLVIVLWIITILISIAMSMSYLSRTELLSTYTHTKDTEFRYYALAGIEKAKVEIVYHNIKTGQQDETIWRLDGTPYTIDIGEGQVDISIRNESGKIDLNYASEEVLKKLLTNHGVSDEQATEIVDAIMDWKDPDDIPRPKGAESDYYQTLKKPYKAKNAPFESVDELINVKGMTKEILYGDDKKQGIYEYLTVYSRTNVISIYHAPLEVLRAIPNISDDTATLILNRRKDFTAQNMHQLLQEVFGGDLSGVSKYVTAYNTQSFMVISEGYRKENPKHRYGIKTVISWFGGNQFNTLYHKEPIRYIQR